MKRAFFVVSAVAVLSATVFGVVDTGVAGAAAPAATGTIGCKITGSGTFSPKLTISGKFDSGEDQLQGQGRMQRDGEGP